jgi:hypothetical protein
VAFIDMREWPPIRWREGMVRADVAPFDGQGLFFAPPPRQHVQFPTMLRKMWSGSEVQAWLDENVNGIKGEA